MHQTDPSSLLPPPSTTSLGVVRSPMIKPKLQAKWVSIEELRDLEEAWHHLTNSALWRNAAMEPGYLISALEHLSDQSVRVLVVENLNAETLQRLVAVVPIETKKIYRLPFKTAEVWKHGQCFDATPLLCKKHGESAWEKICEYLIADQYQLFSLDTVVAEPEVDSIFKAVEQRHKMVRFQRDLFPRAAFNPEPSLGDYLQKHVSKHFKKKIARKLRRLSEKGTVSWEVSNSHSDFDQLAEEFMELEASGWKGGSGTALQCTDATRGFYRQLVRENSKLGKKHFLSLMVDGRRIAMLSDVRSGAYVYCYKTTYDENFSMYSPGMQLEFKNLEYLYRDGILRGDSCTASTHSWVGRIWGQKLFFQNVVLSLRPGIARSAVKALPISQSVMRRLRTKFKTGRTGKS